MAAKSDALKAKRLAAIMRRLKKELGKRELAAFEPFLRQFYQRVAPHDVLEKSVDDLAGAALRMWRFAQRRPAGKARIQVYQPHREADGWSSPFTVIDIVNDDMPFLVDSITGVFNLARRNVHLVIHPILFVERAAGGKLVRLHEDESEARGADRESWIHVEVDLRGAAAQAGEFKARLERTLEHVRLAVEDWRPILHELREAIASLESAPDRLDPEDVAETKAFLEWMGENYFTFLGYREYDLRRKNGKEVFTAVRGSGKGILRDPKVHVLGREGKTTDYSAEVRHFLKQPAPMIVTKTGIRTTVHRPVHMDYVGVKRFDAKGRVVGERRFVGLFTSTAYSRSPRDIPYLRRKLEQVMELSRLERTGHTGKALQHILETYSRDELFQISSEELYGIATGILHLGERPRIRLFVRSDKFKRFASCLVFVPREKHTTQLRRCFEKVLAAAFKGRNSAFYTQVGDASLARLHFIIGRDPGDTREPDPEALEAELVEAARSWTDDLEGVLVARRGEAEAQRLWARYAEAFPVAYRAAFDVVEAAFDIEALEDLVEPDDIRVHLYRPSDGAADSLHFKIYHPIESIALSDCLPVLEHMGLRVMDEWPYHIDRRDNRPPVWIHDFHVTDPHGNAFDLPAIKDNFEATFRKIWSGAVEDDGFNRLVVSAGLEWREIVVLRALAKYMRQAAIPFSQDYIEQCLATNPAIVRHLIALFHARFDPARGASSGRAASRLLVTLDVQLDAVASLDEDRILRWFRTLIQATLRTNYYQAGADGAPTAHVAFKIDSKAVKELPLPRPYAEIFVYSPRVEGVHLRGGKVARGGLRWSDRREDFRTEILDLMKAQTVKNAVIVPVGAKGGFVVKRLPAGGDRRAIMDEVIACYTTFIGALLDLTENYAKGRVVPPRDVVRHDGDDPYLVVAADKGTATFSDIANGISQARGFWLGDAFASGGSNGYDHKKMGITARGAWESVKRHFRETGIDIQTTDFTTIGVGDMAGDVFGNGMLLSEHIKLTAAFNHLHIFLDPDPDPKASFKERQRLFAMPRSSWTDYDAKQMSRGGGVFDRKAKSIALSAQVKRLLHIEADSLTPNDLIRAMLRAPVDLLWFGGIGTYVKAAAENHAEVGDRANDAVRVDAKELGSRVIGEGANLGLTQPGRVEFARAGGRLNTDAVDNAAGVNCSDVEVNIKILLDVVVADGQLTTSQRNRLLARMTDEVAALVLRNNYLQTQAISVAESSGGAQLDAMARLMRVLERSGALNRELEKLPDDEIIAERQGAGLGLTRPEIAVLVAYAKMTLYDALLASDLTEDPYLRADLERAMPEPLHKRYGEAMHHHRLHNEIIATVVANSIVNRAGPTFVNEVAEETGAAPADIARAYAVTRDAFGLRDLWAEIEVLDNHVPADVQTRMIVEVERLIVRATTWFVNNLGKPFDIAQVVADFAPGIAKLGSNLEGLVAELETEAMAERRAALEAQGVPRALAHRIARLAIMAAACHIVAVARSSGSAVDNVGRIYFTLGARLGLDWLRTEATRMVPESPWEQRAITAIVEDLYGQQRALASRVLAGANGATGEAAIADWEAANRTAVTRSNDLIAEFRASGGLDVARLAIANRHVRSLIVG